MAESSLVKNFAGSSQLTQRVECPALPIVHIISSLNVGGLEHFVLRIAAAQRDAGHQVTVLALRDGPLRKQAGDLGLPHFVLGGSRALSRAVRAASILSRLRPRIIHAHNHVTLHYALLGKRITGARTVLTLHGHGSTVPRTRWGSGWSATDAVIAVSDSVAQAMSEVALGTRLGVIHNGIKIDPSLVHSAVVRADLGLERERVIGTMVARMDGRKGHDTLLRALACLKRESLPVTILIVGDGAERANMEQLAQDLGLDTSDVRFLGFRTDIFDLLAASDFFALPSLTEGLPLSVLEAMMHRLPTVATAVGGIPELVEHERQGLLVPPGDVPALAGAISRLVRSADERRAFGQAAYARVETMFSFEQMTREYEGLYARLVTR